MTLAALQTAKFRTSKILSKLCKTVELIATFFKTVASLVVKVHVFNGHLLQLYGDDRRPVPPRLTRFRSKQTPLNIDSHNYRTILHGVLETESHVLLECPQYHYLHHAFLCEVDPVSTRQRIFPASVSGLQGVDCWVIRLGDSYTSQTHLRTVTASELRALRFLPAWLNLRRKSKRTLFTRWRGTIKTPVDKLNNLNVNYMKIPESTARRTNVTHAVDVTLSNLNSTALPDTSERTDIVWCWQPAACLPQSSEKKHNFFTIGTNILSLIFAPHGFSKTIFLNRDKNLRPHRFRRHEAWQPSASTFNPFAKFTSSNGDYLPKSIYCYCYAAYEVQGPTSFLFVGACSWQCICKDSWPSHFFPQWLV